MTGSDHNSFETFDRTKSLYSARSGFQMIQSADAQICTLCINQYRYNSFISSCSTKLASVLVRDSGIYFRHHQGAMVFVKTEAANHTSRNFNHTWISIIQQSFLFFKCNVCHPQVFNTYINIQWRIGQTQQNFIMFVIVLGCITRS